MASVFSFSAGAADYQMAEAYSGLRNMVFNTKPDSVGVKLKEPGEVWGVLMELDIRTPLLLLSH
jgi:hypothetical protein